MEQKNHTLPCKTYTLKLTESQLAVVNQALDIFSRLGIGQFEKLKWLPGFDQRTQDKVELKEAMSSLDFPDLDRLPNWSISIEKLCQLLQVAMTGNSHGTKMRSEKVESIYRKAYDIHQVIRKKLAEDRGVTGWNVDLNDFMKSEPTEPVAIIKSSEE